MEANKESRCKWKRRSRQEWGRIERAEPGKCPRGKQWDCDMGVRELAKLHRKTYFPEDESQERTRQAHTNYCRKTESKVYSQ